MYLRDKKKNEGVSIFDFCWKTCEETVRFSCLLAMITHTYVCAATESISSNRLCLIIINRFINALHAERALSHQLQAFII